MLAWAKVAARLGGVTLRPKTAVAVPVRGGRVGRGHVGADGAGAGAGLARSAVGGAVFEQVADAGQAGGEGVEDEAPDGADGVENGGDAAVVG